MSKTKEPGLFSLLHNPALCMTLTTLLACSLAAPAFAQLGTGWTQTTPTKRIHLDDDVGLQTFTWTTYKSVCSPDICADYTSTSGTMWGDGTETFRIFDSRSNRSEIRLQNDYSTGAHQFEGYCTFYSPVEDESLMQIFGSSSGATELMIRGFQANGGEMRRYTSVVLESGCYGVEKRVNVIHLQEDVGNTIQIYINGVLKDEFADNEAVTNYMKYGCYGTTNGNVPAVVDWRNVRTFIGGGSGGGGATPPGAFEAEDATLSGPVVDNSQPGYTGTGFADYVNASNDYVEWSVDAGDGGDYDLNFRYALQSGDRPLEIQVNGQVIDSSLSFPSTGAWSTWDYVTIPMVTLQAGINSIRATATGSSGPNMDHLLLTGLIAHYTFDDGTANDSSGFGNDGTLEGTAAVVNDPQRGNVLSLDGSGGKVDLGNPASLDIVGGGITITAWVNMNVAGGGVNRNIVNRGHGGSPTRELTLRADSSSNYDFGAYESGVGDLQATMPIPAGDVGTNTWVHLAGTWDGTQWNLYRNAVLENSFADSTGPRDMTVGWAIGARGGVGTFERVFDGLVDDVRIYNIALSQPEIQAIMNPGPPDTTPPAAPTGLGATAGDGSVDLDWADNTEPDLSSYNVYRSTSSGGSYSTIATGVATSAYTDNTATNGTTYYYVVTAVDTSSNESGNSNEASATPADTTAPAAPTGLSATAGDGSVDLDWADNTEPDLDSYSVYRSTTAGGPYSVIATGIASSAYTDNFVTNGTTYYYVVTAVDTAFNESGNSNEASATPQAPPGATSLSVSAIVLSTVNAGKGSKYGQAQVTILDDTGSPVSGATVTGTFTGDYNETQSGVTDGNGVATILTNATVKGGVSFTFCVDDVVGSLPYDSNGNVITCNTF